MAVDQPSPRPRSPGFVYGGLTLVMVVVVGLIAFVSRQPPPPTIAEFAPNAQENIEDAPDEQSSDFGRGPGSLGGGSDAGAPTPTPPPSEREFVDVSRTRKCVGDPPRQTEDPQSPPCVPYWAGDNGGATSKGVTRDEVRIVVPSNAGFDHELLAHFNMRYEFYGRRLVSVGGVSDGDDEDSPSVKMNAGATDADSKNVFASTHWGDAGGNEKAYYDELARRRIVSISGRPGMQREEDLARFHPYQWSYLPGHDKMLRNEAEWICRALNGKPAEFAAGRERAASQRKFGLVYSATQEGVRPDLRPLKEGLARCNITFTAQTEAEMIHGEGDAQGVQRAQNVIIQMQTQGVTTIICACHTQSSGMYMYPNATKQGYSPEWIIGTYMYQAEDSHAATWEASQVERSFGLSWWNKQNPMQDTPWYWAVKEGDPSRSITTFDPLDARYLYNSLLILASGIQLAGPNLTPESFARGLQQARWPNPGAGGSPYYQAEVGFRNEHTAVNDAAIVWLTRTQRSSWNYPGGATCHANRGKRYRLGSWPSDIAGIRQPPCY